MLTAADMAVVDPLVCPHFPEWRNMGTNGAPSWSACLQLVADCPDLLVGVLWFGPSRGDQEGPDVVEVYIPLPDCDEVVFHRVIDCLQPDECGRRYGPDEDYTLFLNGCEFRCLWWD